MKKDYGIRTLSYLSVLAYFTHKFAQSMGWHNPKLWVGVVIVFGLILLDFWFAKIRFNHEHNRIERTVSKIWICFAVFVSGIALLGLIAATLALWYAGFKQFGENTGSAIVMFLISAGAMGCAYAMLLNIRNNLEYWW